MEQLLIETGKQVPSLAILAFIVKYFLMHLEKRDADCKEVSLKTNECINRNSELIGRVETRLEDQTEFIRSVSSKLNKLQ